MGNNLGDMIDSSCGFFFLCFSPTRQSLCLFQWLHCFGVLLVLGFSNFGFVLDVNKVVQTPRQTKLIHCLLFPLHAQLKALFGMEGSAHCERISLSLSLSLSLVGCIWKRV